MPSAEFGQQPRLVSAKFPLRSTSDCYNSFPGEVKSSCPVVWPVAITQELREVFAADPTTGHRHRPAAAEGRQLHEESVSEQIERNRRWLAARRNLSADFE
jgi:hypothetical protein